MARLGLYSKEALMPVRQQPRAELLSDGEPCANIACAAVRVRHAGS